MEIKIHSIVMISILAFAIVGTPAGISTVFENVFVQGEGSGGMTGGEGGITGGDTGGTTGEGP